MTHIPRLIVKGDPPRGMLTLDQQGLVSDHHADVEGSCDDCCNYYIVLLQKLKNCSPTSVYAYAATKDLLAPGDQVQLGTACYRFIRPEFILFGYIEDNLVLKDCATCESEITDPPSAGHCQFTWECVWSCDTETWGTPEIVEQRCVITAVNFDWIFWECRGGNIVARRTTSEPTHPCTLDEAEQPVCNTAIEDLQNEGKVPVVPGNPTDELKIQCCQPHCCAIYESEWDCESQQWSEPTYALSECRDKDSQEKNIWFFHECRSDKVVYRIEYHHEQACANSGQCDEPTELPEWLQKPVDPPSQGEINQCCEPPACDDRTNHVGSYAPSTGIEICGSPPQPPSCEGACLTRRKRAWCDRWCEYCYTNGQWSHVRSWYVDANGDEVSASCNCSPTDADLDLILEACGGNLASDYRLLIHLDHYCHECKYKNAECKPEGAKWIVDVSESWGVLTSAQAYN